MTRSLATVMRQGLIAVHRWLGVALSVNFFIWFASGIGMMYWDFPGVSGADRLNRMIPLDAAAIRVSLADAFSAASLTTAAEVQLESFDGRPVYRFRGGRSQKVIYADTGEPRASISKEQVDRIAAAWVGHQVSNATIRALDAVDQWTVQLPLARLKPLWQYSWPEGEQIYVSQTTGEVVQYTTRASRLGAWVGAIPHWLYVTPLRQHGQLWSRIVIGLSAIGTFVAVLGLTIGLWTFSPSKRYRRQSRPVRWPYRGWKWWHAVFGLSVGMAALTWVFSGMLSMDPFPLPGDPAHTDAVAGTLRGVIDPSAFQSSSPIDAFAAVRPASVKRLDYVSSASRSFYLMTLDSGETRLVDRAGRPSERLRVEDIEQLVTRAIEPDAIVEIRLLDQYDRYYIDRHYSRPLPVVLVRLNDRDATRFYIDPKTARLVGAYSARNWVTRWLYHGLHSLDFPWLYRYRPLWDVIVGAFMVGGTALCFTSLVLAWQVIGRTLSRRLAPDEAPAFAKATARKQ